ncbi:DEAD/DEAH box helicase [Candidatus Nitronereus thalassa]|uniref:DEAD/DEAH box helicase n=1 Tax=Candidatus Nitronereus thalassa TaxID=3020898 RepID=A0ABU3K6X0_9BACT|nr:DEAD/DEAH box helicase [Candidatus Nitronereus thalassa]MDT7042083.1 DEAD/DEAH box helicase [Candidatus Nitronereus thalassa]
MLNYLKALPPNIVYTLAPKDYVVRGYDYFHQERLESLRWEHDRTLLTAVVRGTKRYGVSISIVDNDLNYVCNCPVWTPARQCKHVICALLTIINLLAPIHFKVARHQPRRLEKLRAALLFDKSGTFQKLRGSLPLKPATPAQPDNFELVIHLRDRQPELSVRNHGQRLYTLRGVPETLAYFIGDFYHSFPVHRDRFAQHLQAEGNNYPILFEADGEQMTLKWEPFHRCETHTELNVVDGEVTLKPLYVLDRAVKPRVKLFWDYAVDLDRQVLVRVEEPNEWDPQAMLYDEWMYGLEALDDDQVFSLSREYRGWERLMNRTEQSYTPRKSAIFERRPMTLPLRRVQAMPMQIPRPHLEATQQRLVLKVNGLVTRLPHETGEPVCEKPRFRLVAYPIKDASGSTDGMPSVAALRAECWWGECYAPPHAATFSFFTYLERYRSLPVPLRTQRRKKILRETFLKLLTLSQPSEVESLLRTELSGSDFQRLDTKRAGKHLLKQFFSAYRDPEVRLQFHQGQWKLLSIEKSKEALMYLLPYQQFGMKVFESMGRHDEMRLPLNVLHQGLPHLYDLCRAAGIELFYHTKPVALPQWELSLEAQRPAGIDWFELRPEIRCDGQSMTEAAVKEVMQGNGIIEKDDVVHIFPVQTQEAIQAFSSFYQQEQAAQGKKREWVRVPRLQIFDWIALRKQGVKISLPPEDEAMIDRLMHLEHIEMPPLPQRLNATLRAYQKNGYGWLAFLYQHRFGACLADDMGLGKTVQAISLFGGIKEGIIPAITNQPAPHLVVLPPSLLFNWEQEIQKFYPSLRVHMYAGPDRSPNFTACDVVLTTYGVVRRDITMLETIPFHLIVFDEAQTVKNIYAETTSAVRRLQGAFKMVMTGTPLENHIGEYFSLIDLSVPGLLGDYDKMKSKITSASSSVLGVLTQRTKPFVLRRTKEQILKELPPKTETDVYLDLTEKQKSLYQHTIAQIRPTIDDAYRSKTQAQARIIALTAILKLRQLCLSPRLLQDDSHDSSPKITFIIERLAELMEAGHSALVFSQFTSFLDLVEASLVSHHIPYARLDGSTPTAKRRTLVKKFQEGEGASVFLLSLKAGGQGLNLTKASYVFHLDPWWNPAVENQASDRAHRIGQTQKVSILRILMRHSVEEKMMALKDQKSALYQAVLEGTTHRGTGASITKEDFDFLLT